MCIKHCECFNSTSQPTTCHERVLLKHGNTLTESYMFLLPLVTERDCNSGCIKYETNQNLLA